MGGSGRGSEDRALAECPSSGEASEDGGSHPILDGRGSRPGCLRQPRSKAINSSEVLAEGRHECAQDRESYELGREQETDV